MFSVSNARIQVELLAWEAFGVLARRNPRSTAQSLWVFHNRDHVSRERKKRRNDPAKRERILAQKKAFYLRNRESVLETQKEFRLKNPEVIRQRGEEYRKKNHAILLVKKREEYQRNKARYAASMKAWKEKNPEWERQWRDKNKEALRVWYRERAAKKRATDPSYRAAASMRSRVWALLKKQGAERIEPLGLTKAALKAHLEPLFLPGMTWENYGKWHVDHIRPCASFDLSTHDQVLECFNLKNLRPLWAKDNISKGAKMPAALT